MLKGYNKACGKKTSGILTVALIEAANVTGATLVADGTAYSALTVANEAKFKKYQFQQNEAQFKESAKVENGVYSVTQNLEFKIEHMGPESRDAVEELAEASSCGLIAVISKPDGTVILCGWSETEKGERPLQLSTAEGDTGKKFTDAQGETITLTRESAEKARYFTGDVASLL